MNRQDPVEKIIYLGCIVLLATAILNPRAESLWEKNLLVIGIFFLFACFAINRIAHSNTGSVEWIHTSAYLPLLLFLAYIALQLIPIPLQVLKIISPLTASDKMQLHSWISEFQFSTSNLPYGYCIAYNFHTTLLTWLYTLAFAGMFGLTLHVVSSRRQIDILFFILVVSGDLISINILLQMIFSTWQSVSNSNMASGVIRIFQEKFKRLLELNPSLWKKSVDAIWSYFPDDRIVLEIVPDDNANLRRDILRHLAQKDSV